MSKIVILVLMIYKKVILLMLSENKKETRNYQPASMTKSNI